MVPSRRRKAQKPRSVGEHGLEGHVTLLLGVAGEVGVGLGHVGDVLGVLCGSGHRPTKGASPSEAVRVVDGVEVGDGDAALAPPQAPAATARVNSSTTRALRHPTGVVVASPPARTAGRSTAPMAGGRYPSRWWYSGGPWSVVLHLVVPLGHDVVAVGAQRIQALTGRHDGPYLEGQALATGGARVAGSIDPARGTACRSSGCGRWSPSRSGPMGKRAPARG